MDTKKGFKQIFLTIIVITVMLSAFGYFAFRNVPVKNTIPPSQASITPSTPPDEETELIKSDEKLPFLVTYPSHYQKSATSDVLDNPDYLLSIESWKDFPDTVLRTRNVFQVLLETGSKTPEDCYKRSYYDTTLTLKKTVNGEEFYYTEPFGGAAAGTHDTNEEYKVFHNDTCYQINLIHFESSDWNNPDDVNLARRNKEESLEELHQILSTFKFLGKTDSKILEINYSGGLCPNDRICSTGQTVFRDGTLSRSWSQEIIQIEKNEINELVSLIDSADFQNIRSKKFTGTCPIAYDGQETTYTFYTQSGIEKVASCETEIDYNTPLFSKIEKIVKP